MVVNTNVAFALNRAVELLSPGQTIQTFYPTTKHLCIICCMLLHVVACCLGQWSNASNILRNIVHKTIISLCTCINMDYQQVHKQGSRLTFFATHRVCYLLLFSDI